MEPEVICVYVCPICSGWYGSSDMPELAAIPNIRTSLRNLAHEDPKEWGKSTGSRALCQACKARGVQSERQRVTFVRAEALPEVIERATEEAKARAAAEERRRLQEGVDLHKKLGLPTP